MTRLYLEEPTLIFSADKQLALAIANTISPAAHTANHRYTDNACGQICHQCICILVAAFLHFIFIVFSHCVWEWRSEEGKTKKRKQLLLIDNSGNDDKGASTKARESNQDVRSSERYKIVIAAKSMRSPWVINSVESKANIQCALFDCR